MAYAKRSCEVPRRCSVLQNRGLLRGWRGCRQAADREKDREKCDFHWDRRSSEEVGVVL